MVSFEKCISNSSHFCNMTPFDQEKLLAEKTKLFIELSMGQFLLVVPRHIPTGRDDQMSENDSKQMLFLERYNATMELFLPGKNLTHYSNCIAKLRGLPELGNFQQKAVLAFAVLFFTNDKNSAVYSLNVESMYDSYVRSCENCISLSNLTSNLTEMAALSSKIFTW